MIKAVIFDLDDTLYAEIDYVKSGFRHCAHFIAEAIAEEENKVFEDLLELFNDSHTEVFNRYASRRGLPEGLIARCVAEYRGHKPDLKLSQETEETLTRLRAVDVRLGVVTDGRPEGQRDKLAALGLERLMDVMVITDELGGPEFRKPCSVGYEQALQKLETLAKDAAYVGDNPSKDFVAPNAMGMLTVHYTGTQGFYSKLPSPNSGAAIYEIRDLRELLALLYGEAKS